MCTQTHYIHTKIERERGERERERTKLRGYIGRVGGREAEYRKERTDEIIF